MSSAVELSNMSDYMRIVENNPGLLIIKFEADWCGPCHKIAPFFHELVQIHRDVIDQVLVVDVDSLFEIYAFMKNKKMLTGIPTLFAYYAGNTSYIPNEIVVGANIEEINAFFNRCRNHVQKLRK